MKSSKGAPPPRVSVIVPFLNAEPYLAEAVESVLSQDHRDFELLLVDDGSNDRSTCMALEYARKLPAKIKYLSHPGHSNLGINAARNRGLREARGEFFGFLDADDRWRPSKLAEQVDLFDRNPDVSAVCGAVNYWSSWNGGVDRVYRTGRGQDRKIRPPHALLSWYPLGTAPSPSMSDMLFRRQAALALGGFEESFRRGYTEYPFLARFYLSETIYVSSRVWSDYRQHESSCMAWLAEDGRADALRTTFLKWFEAYLAGSPYRDDLTVNLALQRAMRPSLRSSVARAMKAADRAIRGLARVG